MTEWGLRLDSLRAPQYPSAHKPKMACQRNGALLVLGAFLATYLCSAAALARPPAAEVRHCAAALQNVRVAHHCVGFSPPPPLPPSSSR